LWSSRRLRLPASNIRQFAPKCHLVDGLPVCPQQQAFDAFAAAPGGTHWQPWDYSTMQHRCSRLWRSWPEVFQFKVPGPVRNLLFFDLYLAATILQNVPEARFVSFGTAIISAFGIGAAALSSRWLPPVRVIDVLFISPGIGLPALLVIADYRYRRELRPGGNKVPPGLVERLNKIPVI
jgi:hypothetical protein